MPWTLTSLVPRHFMLALLALVLGLSSLSQAQTLSDTEPSFDWQAVKQPLNEALNYCYLGVAGNTGTRIAAAVDVVKMTCHTKLANQAMYKFASSSKESSKGITVSDDVAQRVIKQPQSRHFSTLKRVVLKDAFAPITEAHELLNRTAVYAATKIRRITDATDRERRKVLDQLAQVAQVAQLVQLAQHFDAVSWIADASPTGNADQAYWDYYGDCEHWNVVLASAEPESSAAMSVRGNWRVFPYREVSNFVAAKLNGLSSNLQHFTRYCLKQIEPDFLKLEFDLVEDYDCI